MEITAYWHIPEPEDGEDAEPPYLVIDVDNYGTASLKICVNDGTVFDSTEF